MRSIVPFLVSLILLVGCLGHPTQEPDFRDTFVFRHPDTLITREMSDGSVRIIKDSFFTKDSSYGPWEAGHKHIDTSK